MPGPQGSRKSKKRCTMWKSNGLSMSVRESHRGRVKQLPTVGPEASDLPPEQAMGCNLWRPRHLARGRTCSQRPGNRLTSLVSQCLGGMTSAKTNTRETQNQIPTLSPCPSPDAKAGSGGPPWGGQCGGWAGDTQSPRELRGGSSRTWGALDLCFRS